MGLKETLDPIDIEKIEIVIEPFTDGWLNPETGIVYHEYVTIDGVEPQPAISFFSTKRFQAIGSIFAICAGVFTYLVLTGII